MAHQTQNARHGMPNESNPNNPRFPGHLRKHPEVLVGMTLVVQGRQLVDYSPDWAKPPAKWHGRVVSHDEQAETYVGTTDTPLGTVTDYDPESETYTVEYEALDEREDDRTHVVPADVVRSKLKDGFGGKDVRGNWTGKQGFWFAEEAY